MLPRYRLKGFTLLCFQALLRNNTNAEICLCIMVSTRYYKGILVHLIAMCVFQHGKHTAYPYKLITHLIIPEVHGKMCEIK